MPPLDSQRNELIAQRLAQGKTQVEIEKELELSQGYVCRLISQNVQISQRRDELLERIANRAELSAARTLEELRRLAFMDIRGIFDERGNLKPIHELTEEQAAAIAGIEVKREKNGTGEPDEIRKVKMLDKTKSLDLLARHFGLLIDKVEHTFVFTQVPAEFDREMALTPGEVIDVLPESGET